MKRYKLWLQIEEIDDEAETYENVDEPVCIGDFDTQSQAALRLYCIARLFSGLTSNEVSYFHSPEFEGVLDGEYF